MKLNVWKDGGKIEFTPFAVGLFHDKDDNPSFLGTIEVTEPKKVVTRETYVDDYQRCVDVGHFAPSSAKNIRVRYDIEE